MVMMYRSFAQCFRGDRPSIDTNPANNGLLLNNNSPLAEFCGLNGSALSGRTRPNDKHIEVIEGRRINSSDVRRVAWRKMFHVATC